MANTNEVLREVEIERARQEAKWGEQNHPDGTGSAWKQRSTFLDPRVAKFRCDDAASRGACTYALILVEEVAEALEETDQAALRGELVQVAAVAVAWIEKIDRDTKKPTP